MRLLRRTSAALAAALLLVACNLDSSVRVPDAIDPTLDTWAPALGVNFNNMTKTASGLWIGETLVGTGATAAANQSVIVRYSGWTPRGFNFDSNLQAAQPDTFDLTDINLIAGFKEGMVGVKVGGKRRLIMPPELAFGRNGLPSAGIPGNSNLLFDVELVGIKQ